MKKNKFIISDPLSNFLDLLRWISALIVVLTHLRSTIMVRYEDLEHINIITSLFYFISNIGHQAVIVFFVLSGFLVGGNVYDLYRNGKFKWNIYLINRTSRLYIVLIPALICGFILDTIGSTNYINYYINTYGFGPFSYNVIDRMTIQNFFINLTMLQGSIGTTFGSNGPLWSLAYEFWYYILFPMILSVFFNTNYRIKLFYLLLIVLVCLMLNVTILIYFTYWIIGVITYQLIKNNYNTFKFPKLSIIIFILSLYISTTSMIPIFKINMLILSITCAYMIYSVNKLDKGLFNFSINKQMSNFSYTVYLFHAPLLLFLTSFMGLEKNQPTTQVIIIFTVFLIFIYLYSYLMYILFEKKTNKYRTYLKKVSIKNEN